MDGPFCSVMPEGKKHNNYLLYHVLHSVTRSDLSFIHPDWDLTQEVVLDKIINESLHFFPFLSSVKFNGYTRTIRAIHDNKDDARVTELITYKNLPNYFSILSGKITTAIQVALNIKNIIQGKPLPIKKIL